MNNEKVIVFGSNGLVGRSVVSKLKNSSKVSDVFASNRKDTDLNNKLEIFNIIEKVNPTVIINCAAKVGGINANNTFRTEFLIDNLKINLNLFEVVKNFKNLKIINLGSSCIYPLNAKNPIKESSFLNGKLEPTNSPYAIAKITGIELGKEVSKQYGNQVINLMPTNLYGPNDNFDELNSHVIPGLIYKIHKAKIENREGFEIWGSGTPLREFMHVDDLSDCIEFMIDKNPNYDLINVGTGEEISIFELAKLIKDIVGFTGSIEKNTKMPDGNPRKLLDTTLINKLGWKSKISLKDGLSQTYSWYKSNI